MKDEMGRLNEAHRTSTVLLRKCLQSLLREMPEVVKHMLLGYASFGSNLCKHSIELPFLETMRPPVRDCKSAWSQQGSHAHVSRIQTYHVDAQRFTFGKKHV